MVDRTVVLTRPVKASAILDSAEMRLRYPGEIELRRDGSDEGDGRGFDLIDLSAGGERTIAVAERAHDVVVWFVEELTRLGWMHKGDGWLSREEGEGFFVRIERDCGVSRVASGITDAANRDIQETFEARHFSGAPEASSVLTLFYTVAPET